MKPITDFEIGGGWGNRLEWSDHKKEWWKDLDENTVLRITGWKRTHPKVGQTMLVECEKSWMIFEFIKIEPCYNPNDMFFGDVKPIKQVMK